MVNTKNKLSHYTLLKGERDARHAASLAALIYINSDSEGITHVKKGKKLLYYEARKQVRNKNQALVLLQRVSRY